MINIPKGTKDVLPSESYKWQYVENCAKDTAKLFGLKEIRTPVFEHTELFLRGVGDTTDIVNKEMYTFEDKGGRSLTLKPEGTAGVARAFVENGLMNEALPARMFYISPAYRYERPQAGRLREHHQIGVEIYGSAEPEADAEVITFIDTFFKRLNLKKVKLQINSIGCPTCRAEYNKALKEYFRPHLDEMCLTCRTRFDKNPLRMLDCKEEGCKKYTANAPKILDYLCPDCAEHFEKVKHILDETGVEYEVNAGIVRGLDYYTRTVFEFVSQAAGAQGTVCGGGRYDNLLEQIGGKSVPAVGYGGGIERLLMVMEAEGVTIPEDEKPELYIAGMDGESREFSIKLAAELRRKGVYVLYDIMKRSVKAQFKYADKLGAKYVLALGENEMQSGEAELKEMATGEKTTVKLTEIYEYLK